MKIMVDKEKIPWYYSKVACENTRNLHSESYLNIELFLNRLKKFLTETSDCDKINKLSQRKIFSEKEVLKKTNKKLLDKEKEM